MTGGAGDGPVGRASGTAGDEPGGRGPGSEDGGTVLVTGATGLVGGHVARVFRERGWRVRALARADSDVRFLEGLEATIVLADVTDPSTLSGAAEGCDVVVHAAAFLGRPAGWERFRAVNVEGTRHVLGEAIRAGCRRFVHLSSVAVYGDPFELSPPVDEDAPTDGPLEERQHYERSKRMSESAVRRAAEGLISWTILRPAVVTGERDRHFAPRVASMADRRLLFTVGPGDNPLPLVYAGNVAEACRLAALREAAHGAVYNVADDGGLTQRELLRDAAPPRTTLVPLPRAVVESAAGAADALAALGPGRSSRVWTRRRLRLLGRPNPFSSEKVREDLGWRPEPGTREGWRRALRWLERSGRG